MEESLSGSGSDLQNLENEIQTVLECLAATVLMPQAPVRRKKLEHLITGLCVIPALDMNCNMGRSPY